MDETMLKMLQGVHDKARAAKIASAVSASRLRCCCVARLPDHGRLVLLHSITGGRTRAAALRAGRFAMKATPPRLQRRRVVDIQNPTLARDVLDESCKFCKLERRVLLGRGFGFRVYGSGVHACWI